MKHSSKFYKKWNLARSYGMSWMRFLGISKLNRALPCDPAYIESAD